MLYAHDFSLHSRLRSLSFYRIYNEFVPSPTFVDRLVRILPKIPSPLENFSLGIGNQLGNLESHRFLLEQIGQALKRHQNTLKTFRIDFASRLPLSPAEISESIQAGMGCEVSFALLITARGPDGLERHAE